YGTEVTEEDVVANAEALRRLAGPGAWLVRVDDGHQAALGDWEANVKFPRGHRWLTDAIHARGLKAGLWIAPFAVSPSSRLYRERPDWLLRGADGQPVTYGSESSPGGILYVLDPGLQPVRAWMKDLMARITGEWKYDHIQLDLLF